jgi:hypothetical protein
MSSMERQTRWLCLDNTQYEIRERLGIDTLPQKRQAKRQRRAEPGNASKPREQWES